MGAGAESAGGADAGVEGDPGVGGEAGAGGDAGVEGEEGVEVEEESAAGVESGAGGFGVVSAAFVFADGADVVSGAEASGVWLAAGAEASAGAGELDEPEPGAVAVVESAIFSFGMTCAMPSSALSRRSVSVGYFVFHAATSFPKGLISMTEKRRVIAPSSIARIKSMD